MALDPLREDPSIDPGTVIEVAGATGSIARAVVDAVRRGYSTDVHEHRFGDDRPTAVLGKPFPPSELVQLVASIVGDPPGDD